MGFDQRNVQDRIGILYFIAINQAFGPLAGILTVFPTEKKIVYKEVVNQSYSITAYFISRVIAEMSCLIPLTCKF